ncbi:MAG TPA: TonB-dependent receptor plug domain-containing protein [Lacunisphaera sp.]|nr:TonB-dependent receptor plug domain-containing protein [Lacunisphaera sp.]
MKADRLFPVARRCATPMLAALLPLTIAAQTTPAVQPVAEDTVVLSPFVVTTSEAEDGYLARLTTAGTRTKTELKDVGASIDVLTDEFLNDMGALNMNDALKYVANMSNYDGADNDLTNSSQWFAAPYNARGFRSDSSLIDFFPVPIISIDRYNTESLTFLKGSNAILFGIGSPGGSINASYKRANLGRHNYTFSYTTDSNESHRGEFDINRVLIENKLGIRVAALGEERHTFKEPSLDRKRGFYGTATYRPFRKTSITVAADEGRRSRYLELNNVVLDSYTPWVLAGKPTINWKTRGNPAALTPEANDAVGVNRIERISTNPVLIHVEGLGTQNWRHMGESAKLGSAPNRIAFNEQNNVLTAPDGKEWRLDLSTNVWGNMNYHTTEHRSKSLFVQQNIIDGLDVELAANTFDVEYSSNAAGWANRPEIQADPNELLPDGTPNPNVGKPYIEADRHRDDTERREFTNYRATVSYEFNLDERKLFGNVGLGRYKLLGLWERQDLDVWVATGEQINLTPGTAPTNGGPAFAALLDNGQNQIRRRYYFEPGETVYRYDGPLAGRNVGAGITPGWGITSNIRQSTQTTESLVGVVQAQWWESRDGYYRIVGMYGTRNEDFTSRAKAFTKGANGLYAGDYRDIKGVTGQGTWNAPNTRKPKTKTYSIVGRPLANVSLFYNFSDIFSTADANFRDVHGDPLRPVFGDTQDYGVKLDLFKNRIAVHLTKYETRQFDQNLQIGGNVRTWSNEIWTALATHHSPTGAMPDAAKFTQFSDEVREIWRSYRDDSTKGYELSIAGRITESWNVRVSAGKQNTIIAATNNDTDAWVTDNWDLWQGYAAVRNPAISDPANARYTVGGTASEVRRQLDEERAVIGLRQGNQRQYNVRVNTTYGFRHGFLKGFNAGIGARWDSANTLGFARVGTVTPVTPLDINNPYLGSELFNVDLNLSYSRNIFQDKVRWSIYLNVYNVLDEGGLRHRQAVDSGIDHNRLITERYMIAPRSFQVRNTFSF